MGFLFWPSLWFPFKFCCFSGQLYIFVFHRLLDYPYFLHIFSKQIISIIIYHPTMGQAVELIQMIASFLVESNLDDFSIFTTTNGLNPDIKEAAITILTVFREITHQSDDYLNHVFFYRDVIKKLVNGENVSSEYIKEQFLIQTEKQEETISMLKKLSEKDEKTVKLEIKIGQIEEERNMFKTSFKNSENKIQLMQESMVKLEEESNQIKSKLNESILELDSHCELKQSMILQNTEKEKQLEKQCLQLEEEIGVLKKLIDDLEEENEDLKKDEHSQKTDKIGLLKENKELKQKIETFEIEKKSVIKGIRKEGLSESKESSWVSLVSEEHITQQNEIKQKDELIAKHEKTIKARDKKIKQQKKKTQAEFTKKNQTIEDLQDKISNLSLQGSIKKPNHQLMSEIFIDTSSMISHLGIDPVCGQVFLDTVNKQVGEIKSMTSLYNFALHQRENFHKRVDGKKNIMLVCLTEEGKIIGGFSSAGFTLKTEEKNTKAFLFSFEGDQMRTYKLKNGRESTLYDYDFILFGQEQLCIENGSNELTSYWVAGSTKLLHYQSNSPIDHETFLSQKARVTTVKLKKYEIIELKLKQKEEKLVK